MHINTTNQANLFDLNWLSVLLSQYILHPLIVIILCLLSVFIVLGNLLVVSAIWHENQLHSVTNYLIASLAAADCLVGALVMPFCIISEIIIGSWTFGANWCDLWHSFDVLASTASIMNLCAISLDRYLAITDPISYPSRMTPKRVALLIGALWTCSSLISFPAILWWRSVGHGPLQPLPNNDNADITTTTTTTTTSSDTNSSDKLYRCVFTDDTYYLLFSSFVSFYGPLCVMLYAYYCIYKAAVQQTRFLKYGSKQVMIARSKKSFRYISENEKNTEALSIGTSNTENYDSQHLVLRAHRGGGGGATANTTTSTFNNNTTTELVSKELDNTLNAHNEKSSPDQQQQLLLEANIGLPMLVVVASTDLKNSVASTTTNIGKPMLASASNASSYTFNGSHVPTVDGNASFCTQGENQKSQSDCDNEVGLDHQEQVPLSNITRQPRSVGKKLSKLAKERKAAKTLGIVVGVFILCWLPFFVVNIVVALCGTNCIYNHDFFASIVTWLGWLNSAMNPVIYACWSRDFRRAFHRVLCTWIEFICPYNGSFLAKQLKLKKKWNYSGNESNLNKNFSPPKANTSSVTIHSGMSTAP